MPRRYSEEDAQRIFALVADRQRLGAGDPEGLSLSELEEAARAAGLDPSLVAGAAAQIDAAPGRDRTVVGAPVEVVRQRMLPGEVDDDTWAQMVQAMRSEFGDVGMAGQVGRLREWTLFSGGTKNGTAMRLSIEPSADGTRVTISRTFRDVVLGFSIAAGIQAAVGVMFALFAATTGEAALWIPCAIVLAMAALMGGGAQVGARVGHRQIATRFEALLDRLELVARDAPPARDATDPARLGDEMETLAAGDVLEAPRLRLDLDDPTPEADASSRTRTRT